MTEAFWTMTNGELQTAVNELYNHIEACIVHGFMMKDEKERLAKLLDVQVIRAGCVETQDGRTT